MSWYKVAFPEDVHPYSDADGLISTSEDIFQNNERPQDFCVFQEVDKSGSKILYFTPTASGYCRELLQSYRGSRCDKPLQTPDRPIAWVVGSPICQKHFE